MPKIYEDAETTIFSADSTKEEIAAHDVFVEKQMEALRKQLNKLYPNIAIGKRIYYRNKK